MRHSPGLCGNAQNILREAGLPEATAYYGDENSWKQLCDRDDIDLVYVATDWRHHAEMGIYAMEHGKHVAIEVPAAMTLEEIWALINTSERRVSTVCNWKTACMISLNSPH